MPPKAAKANTTYSAVSTLSCSVCTSRSILLNSSRALLTLPDMLIDGISSSSSSSSGIGTGAEFLPVNALSENIIGSPV